MPLETDGRVKLRMGVDPAMQKPSPVSRRNVVQRVAYVVESVGPRRRVR